jgi:hypothetical protein
MFSKKLLDIASEAEIALAPIFKKIEEISFNNTSRVLDAFREFRVSEAMLCSTTGYGYDDIGRDTLDKIYASVFGAESAFVRHSIANGTQALTIGLFGLLRPGDVMLSVTNRPYDTLCEVVGIDGANGNGSLTRIHPVVLYCIAKDIPDEESVGIIKSYSALTHAHERSLVGCVIFYFLLKELILSPSKDSVQTGIDKSFEYIKESSEAIYYSRVLSGEIITADECEIKSSGYVVDTLEAAIWALMRHVDYKSTVLCAVNLGEDTDTVAAVVGALCGVLYGASGIPNDWLSGLVRRDYIEELCDKAYKTWL